MTFAQSPVWSRAGMTSPPQESSHRKELNVYLATWGAPGVHEIRFEQADELPTVLDKAQATIGDYTVLIHLAVIPDTEPDVDRVDLLVGHPYRAALSYTAPRAHTTLYAVQTAVPPLRYSLIADVNGEFESIRPAATRLNRQMAWTATAEWIRTGRRPTCIPRWERASR